MKSYNKRNYQLHKKDKSLIRDKFPIGNISYKDSPIEDIILSSMKWVEEIARSFNRSEISCGVLTIEDLIQEGYIGLVLAANKIDRDLLLSADRPDLMLKEYASMRIWRSIRDGINTYRGQMRMPHRAIVSASKGEDKHMVDKFFNSVFKYLSSMSSSKGNEIDVEDKVLNYDIDQINRYLVGIVNKYLDADEAYAVKSFYGMTKEPMNTGQIGIDLGIHGRTVNKLISNGVSKLKDKVDYNLIEGLV